MCSKGPATALREADGGGKLVICANAAELLQQHEALDLTDEVVRAAVEQGVHERTRRHASMDPASGDGSRDELSSASRTLTSAAREARVALLAGGRVGRDILRMPVYRIPPLTGVGEGGDAELSLIHI